MFNFLSDPSVLLSTSAAVWLSGVGATRLGETDDLPLGERALKKSDVALRFGPQLPPKAIAAQFDKITGAFIATSGLQNFASPNFNTPIVDTFSTLGQLALSFEEIQSICVSRCHNNPACKAVGISGPRVGTCECGEEGEAKTSYSCRFINPDLGPGAYIAQEPEGYRDIPDEPGVVYTKKAGNPTVVPSHDDVACDISTFTIVNDITCYYTCLVTDFNACFEDCYVTNNGDPYECVLTCRAQVNEAQCGDDCKLTSDFRDYILPATDCLVNKGGDPEAPIAGLVVLNGCLNCLTNGRVGTAGICTANDEKNFVRGPCQDWCYEVPLTGTSSTLDITSCEPMLQAAMLCYNGANVGFASNSPNTTAGGGVNRNNSTTPFACPE